MSAIVYVDHENIPFQKYDKLLGTVLQGTKILCYKIFASTRDIAKLDEFTRLKHKYILCQRPVTRDKNSADISLVIEVMKDLYRNPAVQRFIIFSNDSDFIPVCKEVQESGKICWLIIDSLNANENCDKIYDKVIDIGKELRLIEQKEEEERKEKIALELAERRIAEEKKLLEEKKLVEEEKKVLRKKIKNLLNEFKICNYFQKDGKKINLTRFQYSLQNADIDWNALNMTYSAFLKTYLPAGYKREGNFIIPS
jgi:predicted nuclease of predicted toxin-antitoxin system